MSAGRCQPLTHTHSHSVSFSPSSLVQVAVYEDPHYPTFVFHTSAGRSSCLYEENTARRTLPLIAVAQSPLTDTIPTETAIYTLVVTNGAETKEAGDYELFTDLASNEDGLHLSVNGMPFTDVMRYLAFPYGTTQVC